MHSTVRNLRHLRAFEASVRLASISRAAEEVHVSQSAVSQAIANLERSLGVELLQRSRTGSFVTPYGQIFRIRVERALERVSDALMAASENGRAMRSRGASPVANVTATQINVLIAIEENGSFSAAARAAGISQPAVNRSAGDLERNLRRSLFRRTPTGKATNRLGTDLAHRLRLALHEIDYAVEELDAARGQSQGTIPVGILPLGASMLLTRALMALSRSHPKAHVKIVESPYEALAAWLRTGVIDVMVGTLRPSSPGDDVTEEPLFSDPYCVVVRPSHPMARLKVAKHSDLARYEWILPRLETPRRQAWEALFGDMPRRPPIVVETSSMATTRDLLLSSDRVTLLSRDQISFEERLGLLKVIPAALPRAGRMIGLTSRTDWLPTDAESAFLEHLRRESLSLVQSNELTPM